MSYVFVIEIPDDEMHYLMEERGDNRGPVDIVRGKLEPRNYYNTETVVIMVKEGA